MFALAGPAPTLASGTNASAFNVGNTVGPWLGGLVIAAGLGLRAPAALGVLLAASALGLGLLSRALDGAHARRSESADATRSASTDAARSASADARRPDAGRADTRTRLETAAGCASRLGSGSGGAGSVC